MLWTHSSSYYSFYLHIDFPLSMYWIAISLFLQILATLFPSSSTLLATWCKLQNCMTLLLSAIVYVQWMKRWSWDSSSVLHNLRTRSNCNPYLSNLSQIGNICWATNHSTNTILGEALLHNWPPPLFFRLRTYHHIIRFWDMKPMSTSYLIPSLPIQH